MIAGDPARGAVCTVAYVPKAGGPPDSSGYMWAGYAVTAAAYVGYIVLLLRRMARARKAR